ncbi:MAG: V-type ATP synthase subunit I, partial [Bacteroidaceae bacterium]|nr:V-type ATP synthase subunit I [Bacteroidaceae bacterium]
MNKLTLLVYHKEYVDFLQRLREVGVVHVVEKNSGAVDDPELEKQLALAARYIRTIKKFESLVKDKPAAVGDVSQAAAIVERADGLAADIERRKVEVQVIEKDIATLEPWGEFQHSRVEKLREAGYDVRFFITGAKNYDSEWEQLYNSMVVSQKQSRVYFVTVTRCGEEFELDAEQAKLPAASLSALIAERELALEHIASYEKQLADFATENLNTLCAAHEGLQHDIEFAKVVLDGEKVSGDKLLMLEGWVPAKEKKALVELLDSQSVFYEIKEPEPGDDVPVRFNNNALFRLFEPICELYMLPKYSELDLTPFFAPFYMLFFGLCLGDMGYGLFITILSAVMLIVMRKKGASLIGYMRLALTLGISTVICGSLTGTFFGFNIYNWGVPLFDWWRDNFSFAAVNPETGQMSDPNDKLFTLSLILGGIQICYAMVIKIVNTTIQVGFKYAVATLGWLMVIIGAVIAMFVPAVPMTVVYAICGVGAAGALLYNSPGKNIFL